VSRCLTGCYRRRQSWSCLHLPSDLGIVNRSGGFFCYRNPHALQKFKTRWPGLTFAKTETVALLVCLLVVIKVSIACKHVSHKTCIAFVGT
jgi:hypothetical protein